MVGIHGTLKLGKVSQWPPFPISNFEFPISVLFFYAFERFVNHCAPVRGEIDVAERNFQSGKEFRRFNNFGFQVRDAQFRAEDLFEAFLLRRIERAGGAYAYAVG